MSSLLGWLGPPPRQPDVLQAMADACDLPQSPLQAFVTDDFTVAATNSVGGSSPQRLATSADGEVVVAFAGQLYDEDLTRKHQPAATCLELYQRHGPGFAVHLNGTFALAVYDRSAGQLHLITDRMASRGLYYHTAAPLVFGTEVKFVLEYPGISRRVNPDCLREFLATTALSGTATYYDHIRQIPSATVRTWEDGRCHEMRYWTPQFCWEQHGSLDEHAEQVAAALRHAMRRVCAGHERMGLLLSGGMDSRAVACAGEAPLQCMTLHSSRGMEVSLAARVAAARGHAHHFIPVSEDYPLELVTPGSLIGDGMGCFHHAQAWLARPLVDEHQLSLLLSGALLDSLYSGNTLPRGNEVGWSRLLPPRLPPAHPTDSMGQTVRSRLSAPATWLDSLLRDCSVAEVQRYVRDKAGRFAAEVAPYLLTSHDLPAWLELSNVAKANSILNVTSVSRYTDEGVLAYDNEAVAAFLALPPDYRFHYRAYRRALALLDAGVARIPRSWTGLPIVRKRQWEAWHHYRAWCSAMGGELRARRCDYRRHDRAPWPRMRTQVSHSAQWRHFLHRRLRASPLVDLGILEGDALRRLVKWALAGRGRVAYALAPWITLDEWLTRYG